VSLTPLGTSVFSRCFPVGACFLFLIDMGNRKH
jgi:hypothetical protein